MYRLDRHIRFTVLVSMALVLLVLGGLDLLFSAVDELGDTNDNYRAASAMAYVLYTFPRHLYELMPMSAMIGALAGLGMLASHNELVVMQASGVSRGRIVVAVMKPTLLVMVLGLLLGEVVSPPLELRAEVNKSAAQGRAVGLSRFGHWERDGSSFIHFNTVEPEGVLYGVTILEFDAAHQIVSEIEASQAVYTGERPGAVTPGGTAQSQRPPTGSRWLLQDGSEKTFTRGDGTVTMSQLDFISRSREIDLTPDLLQVLLVDPDNMAISDLYRYAQRFEGQGLDSAPYFLAFWKKALQPFSTAVLVLLAVSFIFGPLREATMGSRVFTAISFGLIFTVLQQLMHSVSLVYQIPPLFAVVLPLLLCAGLGWMLFRRAV
jgi:lipopolysaccharide export system permease protein